MGLFEMYVVNKGYYSPAVLYSAIGDGIELELSGCTDVSKINIDDKYRITYDNRPITGSWSANTHDLANAVMKRLLKGKSPNSRIVQECTKKLYRIVWTELEKAS